MEFKLIASPSVGAYFASRSLPNTVPSADWNVFAVPAAISLGLLVIETLYLAARLPETRNWSEKQVEKGDVKAAVPVDSVDARLRKLRAMGRLHGLFLLFFSGVRPSWSQRTLLMFRRNSL